MTCVVASVKSHLKMIANRYIPNEPINFTSKIKNEIFDKSIEDIEKLFNFKINGSVNESITTGTATTSRKRKLATSVDQRVVKHQAVVNSDSPTIPQRKINVNSIYLQDFNLFRDDLLDELYELHEFLSSSS